MEKHGTVLLALFVQFMNAGNDIDGETLLLLVNDIDEFSTVVTKTAARLKIKKCVTQVTDLTPSREENSRSPGAQNDKIAVIINIYILL